MHGATITRMSLFSMLYHSDMDFPKIVTRRVALAEDASWTQACFSCASPLTYPTTYVCVDTDLSFSQATVFL